MKKINIAIADDEELFRKGMRFLLERETNFNISYEAENGKKLIGFISTTKEVPDIILMDLKMPFVSGIDATKIIHKEFPVVKIIALTSYNTKAFIANMINVGASSYLVKSATPKEMIDTINKVAQKGFYYNETVLQVIQDDIIATDKSMINLFDQEYLTVREKEVLELICMQFSTHEIAEKLSKSSRTVEGHRNNLLLKTESKNIAGLVVYAIQKKVVVLDTF